jgi:sugar phosphate isomerase/epimerase
MRRRTFLQSTPGIALSAPRLAAAAEGTRLGFDVYSIRNYHWKAMKLLEYAGSLKLDTIQISSLNDYESLEPAHLQKVKDYASSLGIMIDAGIGSICPTSKSWNKREGDPTAYLSKGLRVAKALGAQSMRCYMGSGSDRHGSPLPIEGHMEATIKALRSVRNLALDLGVKPALENHNGDLRAQEVKTVIEEAGKDFVGSCLDAGNPLTVMEDPLYALEVLGPYVVTTHIRDSVVFEQPQGAAWQWTALGDGTIDFQKYFATFHQVCPTSSVQLEIITGRPPQVMPYLDPEFWKDFPKTTAAEFARFVILAKKGHPFLGTMVIAGTGKQPPEIEAALQLQQKTDLERSLEYAKKTLGLGIRWRT